jgi:hypothetical protein
LWPRRACFRGVDLTYESGCSLQGIRSSARNAPSARHECRWCSDFVRGYERAWRERRTRRCSEREPADSLTDKFNLIGGWLPSLTLSLGAMRHHILFICVGLALVFTACRPTDKSGTTSGKTTLTFSQASSAIKPGMRETEVLAKLGTPYSAWTASAGERYLEYQLRQQEADGTCAFEIAIVQNVVRTNPYILRVLCGK